MSFAEAIKAVLGNYAKFDGRARRSEYWYFVLFYVAVVIVLEILGGILGRAVGGVLLALFLLGVIIPMIAVGVRRMHDTDHSGWWLICPIVPLVFALMDGSPGPNRFGPSPKGDAAPAPAASMAPPPPPPPPPPA
ncbi:MAG: DUF805 domain-containing protein [Aeromicrobium sp.]